MLGRSKLSLKTHWIEEKRSLMTLGLPAWLIGGMVTSLAVPLKTRGGRERMKVGITDTIIRTLGRRRVKEKSEHQRTEPLRQSETKETGAVCADAHWRR